MYQKQSFSLQYPVFLYNANSIKPPFRCTKRMRLQKKLHSALTSIHILCFILLGKCSLSKRYFCLVSIVPERLACLLWMLPCSGLFSSKSDTSWRHKEEEQKASAEGALAHKPQANAFAHSFGTTHNCSQLPKRTTFFLIAVWLRITIDSITYFPCWLKAHFCKIICC